jgi:SAM-dependent methyltransferase
MPPTDGGNRRVTNRTLVSGRVLGDGSFMRGKKTSERRTLGSGARAEDQVQDLFHAFPYHYVKRFATPDTRVLDVGFGDGYGAEILSESVREYVGVDNSELAVREARARYDLPNVTFTKSDGTVLPFSSGSFDLVVSFHVLEHIAQPEPYLTELMRVCRTGGRVVIVTPNRAFRLDRDQRPWNRFHVREFDATDLLGLLSDPSVDTTVYGITGSSEMIEVERRRVGRAQRLARFDVLGLRYRLPESFLVRVRRVATAFAARASQDATGGEFSLTHLRCVEASADGSVHLLALLRKDAA